MINNLLNLKGFLNSPAGIAVFCVATAALLILILDLNYRLFAKRLLDYNGVRNFAAVDSLRGNIQSALGKRLCAGLYRLRRAKR